METLAVVGLQWGDEGKGKIVDLLSRRMDVIVRCQGGSNAGHTVVIGKEKYALHLVPSGILTPGKINVIANGVVIDPVLLVAEISDLRARGVAIDGTNLIISDRAHVVFNYHKAMDKAQENMRSADGKLGTTGRGIGPAYSDKYSRSGFRMGDIVNGEFRGALAERMAEKNFLLKNYYKTEIVAPETTIAEIEAAVEVLRPHVTDTAAALVAFLSQGKKVLFEGAQGALLDIDYGTYPYVTSSNTTTAGIPAGTGLPPAVIRDVLGVLKAYTTRVGAGPFPTELLDEMGETLRAKGGEFGATTGRPRRCGWFDAVVARHAVAINGCTQIALTKIDVLDGLEKIKICVAYTVDGKRTERMPAGAAALERAKPVYEEMPGWKGSTAGARDFADLPVEAQKYVKRLEELSGCPVKMISVGMERMAVIMR